MRSGRKESETEKSHSRRGRSCRPCFPLQPTGLPLPHPLGFQGPPHPGYPAIGRVGKGKS